MVLSLQRILSYILILTGLAFVFIPNFEIFGAFGLCVGFILAYREHQKNKRQSNKQKHTKKRSGQVYDKDQNEKRGNKNKKFKKNPNPNKKKNDEQ